MSYVDDLRGEITQRLDSCEDFLDTAQKEGPGLIHQFVDHELKTIMPLPWARNEIADHAIDYFNKAIAHARDGLAQQREMNANLGSPDTLRATADTISEKISGADKLAMSKESLDGMLNWDDGAASKKYEFAYDDQAEQVAKIAKKAGTLHDVLRSLADGIESYYAQLLAAVISFAAAVLGAIGAVLSIIVGAVTSETGVGAVLGLIGAIIGAVVAILGVIGAVISVIMVFQTLQQSVNNNLDALSATTEPWKVPNFVTMG